MSDTPRWRIRVAQVCDVVAGVMVAQAVWSHLFGGYRLGAEPFVLSTRSAGRILIEVLVLVALRHVVLWRPSLRDRIAGWLRARSWSSSPVSWREAVLAGILYLPLVAVYLWPQLAQPSGVPDPGDPLFSMWALSHVADSAARGFTGLLDGRIFHPSVATYAWSDLGLLPGLIAAPFLWLGVPLAAVYGLLIVAACWASGVTLFALARATGAPWPAAWMGGALLAFLPYRFAHYSHLQMQGVFLAPLALLCLLRALERPTPTRGLLLAVAVAMQAWWSTYLGAFVIVALGGVTLGWWLSGRDVTRAHVRAMVLASVACVVLMTPYLAGYIRAHDVVASRPREEVAMYSAEAGDYRSPNGNHAWYGAQAPIHEKNAERHLSLGVAPWVLGAVGLLTAPTAATVALSTGLLVALDGSLGLNGAVYPVFYDYVPLLRPFRVPARFGLIVGVFLAWAAALGAGRLWRAQSAPWSRALVLLVCVAAIVEARPALTLTPLPTTMDEIYASLPSDRDATLLELPVRRLVPGEFSVDPWYLYQATFHKYRLINGYSGHFPSWYHALGEASAALPDAQAFALVAARGPDFIVVHQQLFGAARYREVVDALDDRPEYELLAVAADGDGEDRLYRLTRAARPVSRPD
jgi:hypothetical protein